MFGKFIDKAGKKFAAGQKAKDEITDVIPKVQALRNEIASLDQFGGPNPLTLTRAAAIMKVTAETLEEVDEAIDSARKVIGK